MTTPDDLIAQNGEPVTLTRVTDFDAGRDGVANVTRELETVQAIVHSPSESQTQRLEGRLQDGAISVTLPSDTDVEADRDGGRDRLLRPDPNTLTDELTLVVDDGETFVIESGETVSYSEVELNGDLELQGDLELTGESLTIPEDTRIYTVEDVSDDTHPMVDITKLTVVCNELDREDLSEDADTYTEV